MIDRLNSCYFQLFSFIPSSYQPQTVKQIYATDIIIKRCYLTCRVSIRVTGIAINDILGIIDTPNNSKYKYLQGALCQWKLQPTGIYSLFSSSKISLTTA